MRSYSGNSKFAKNTIGFSIIIGITLLILARTSLGVLRIADYGLQNVVASAVNLFCSTQSRSFRIAGDYSIPNVSDKVVRITRVIPITQTGWCGAKNSDLKMLSKITNEAH